MLSIVRAFVADPLVRWFFPDDETYVQRASTFFGLLFDGRVDDGNVHVAGDGAAVSMWDPPGGGSIAQAELDRRWVDEFEPGAGPGERERLEAYEAAAEAMMPAGSELVPRRPGHRSGPPTAGTGQCRDRAGARAG